MLTVVLALSAFVCPPVEENRAKVGVGQPCGGTCDTLGECEEGLECYVAPSTSPMSFAILMGATKKGGVCRASKYAAEPVEDRRALAGGQRIMAGGHTEAGVDEPEVLAAAKWGVVEMTRMSNSLDPLSLTRIVDAKKQVVAGIKYTLTLAMSDGTQHRVEVVDQPWMTPRYRLVAHEVLQGEMDAPGRQLQMVGGARDVDVDDAEVLAAAKWGVQAMARASNALSPAALTRITSAKKQLVAGVKYTLHMIMSDGSAHTVQILDQAWMTPRYTMISDDIELN